MKKSVIRLIVVVVGLCPICHERPASARIHKAWTWDEANSASDLIVIAVAISTKETGEKAVLAGQNCAGLTTTFRVETIFKGKLEGRTFQVLYYEFVDGDGINGPGLVEFQTGPLLGDGRPSYILFLKKLADGRFEAVTGQVDPDESIGSIGSIHLLPNSATLPSSQPSQ